MAVGVMNGKDVHAMEIGISGIKNLGVPTRIVSLNRIVHLNNLNRFVRAEPYCLGKLLLTELLKSGYGKK